MDSSRDECRSYMSSLPNIRGAVWEREIVRYYNQPEDGHFGINQSFIHLSTQIQYIRPTVKTVKSNWKEKLKSAYNCCKRLINEARHCTKTKRYNDVGLCSRTIKLHVYP